LLVKYRLSCGDGSSGELRDAAVYWRYASVYYATWQCWRPLCGIHLTGSTPAVGGQPRRWPLV